jgi:predicted Na+-dependent transporter
VAGIWSQIDATDLGIVIALNIALLAIVLVATTVVSRLLGFSE